MLILLLALIALPTPTLAKSKPPVAKVTTAKKSHLLDQLHKTCVKNSFQEGKSQDAVCDCLKANYEKKLGEEDLELLARIQNGTVNKSELEGKDELLEFDMEASQHCVDDTGWRWVPAAKVKDESVDGKIEETKTEETEAIKKAEKPVAKPAAKPKKALKAAPKKTNQ